MRDKPLLAIGLLVVIVVAALAFVAGRKSGTTPPPVNVTAQTTANLPSPGPRPPADEPPHGLQIDAIRRGKNLPECAMKRRGISG